MIFTHMFVEVVLERTEMRAIAKIQWIGFILYLAIAGSYIGLEIDSYMGDLPFFRLNVLLLFVNVLFIPFIPPILHSLPECFSGLRNRACRAIILILNTLYLEIVFFIALYKSIRKMDFDFYFLWYNTEDVLPVIWKIFAPGIPIVVFLTVALFLFQKSMFAPASRWFRRRSGKALTITAAVIICGIVCQSATLRAVRGSVVGFIYANFISDCGIRDAYEDLYQNHIAALKEDLPQKTDRFNPSALGDVVFVVKQESLNGLLAGTKITPQLLRAARDGILFPEMYGNAIQSLRGYGCTLCGTPPSMTEDLADAYSSSELNALNCLPKVFRDIGYHTLYFFGGSRNPRIVHFAESIGFEHVLADDIMQPEDIKFDWGYREDIFYIRVFQYLQTHYTGEKLFVFLDTGATNHAPFEVLDKALLDKVPFPRTENFTEKISNTTFAQDAYFGMLYDMFRKDYGENGTLLAVSDHSWPIPIHKDNIYNERGAYEENFRIALLFVPPLSKNAVFDVGAVISRRFSQMDILPTFLDMLGMERRRLLGESFAPWLFPTDGKPETVQTNLSIQPYGGGFISVVQYPKKYLFDALGQNVQIYDLEKDPEERSPSIQDINEYMSIIRDFFRSGGVL